MGNDVKRKGGKELQWFDIGFGYEASNNGTGWILKFTGTEKKRVRNPKTGGFSESVESYEKYYGVLWHMLSGFVKDYMEKGTSLEDIKNKADEATALVKPLMDRIEAIDKEMAENYRTVKVSNN